MTCENYKKCNALHKQPVLMTKNYTLERERMTSIFLYIFFIHNKVEKQPMRTR